MDIQFDLMSGIGLIIAIGMVVNNGIMLIDATNEYIKEGMVVGEALITAGTTRIRPILVTTLTTVLSMVPLLLSGDSGVNMMRGMGVVIIGGLTASTILAMFLIPPFYLLFSGKDMNGMTRKERRAAALDKAGETEKEGILHRLFGKMK